MSPAPNTVVGNCNCGQRGASRNNNNNNNNINNSKIIGGEDAAIGEFPGKWDSGGEF